MAVPVASTLEMLEPGARVHGVLPDGPVEVVQVAWHGSAALTLTYRRADGPTEHRCLVVTPGSLVEQWQDELYRKLGLDFDLVGRDTIESSRSGNPFAERNLIIARLDHLSRNEDVQAKLEQTDWDLVVVDEAHKMSAHYFGAEVKETGRFRLGRLLGNVSRNLLLMTATPHSGKDDDFQLFLSLLDADRFEGRPRGAREKIDTSGLMRRLVKERLVTVMGLFSGSSARGG